MKKYLSLFSEYYATVLEYRANLIGTLALEAISVLGILVLWIAVYRSQDQVAGFSFGQTFIYYSLIPLAGLITKVEISDKVGGEIRAGTFSNYLLKPYRFWVVTFMEVLAKKINYLVLASPVYLSVFGLLFYKNYLAPNLINLASGLAIASLAFFLHFVLDLSIAFWAFWVDDVWAFKHLKNILFSVLGGISFPLDFVSGFLKDVINVLPFKYFYYVPIAYLLGRRSGLAYFMSDCANILVWTLFFTFLGFITWRLGLKKYGAYGY